MSAGQRHLPSPEAYLVTERLIAGGFPFDGEDGSRVARYEALGVGVFVDLTHPTDPLPSYEPHLSSATRIAHPIVDMATPTVPQMRRILDDIDEGLSGDGAVYVHCWGGIGRTGTVVGCWLQRHGLDEGDAIARIAALRRMALDSSMPSPQTTAQRAMVRGWRRGR
ncbi:MAG: hypothetical protein U0R50_02085 [Gaiellales bacterium]